MIDGDRHRRVAQRDRGVRAVWLVTAGGVGGAIGLSAVFAGAAAATFSGSPAAAHQRPPVVPDAAAPLQQTPLPPIVVERVVHHPYLGVARQSTGYRPAPPAAGPVPVGAPAGAPAPPPPPPCLSTPSHPC